MGCLVLLGVVMLSVSCLAFFGWTGAITADPGRSPASPAAAITAPLPAPAGTARAVVGATSPTAGPPGPGRPTPPPLGSPAARPAAPTTAAGPAGTATAAAEPPPAERTPGAGPESVAQRLDREAVGGGVRVTTLGAARTTQGDRAVVAIYVRIENDGSEVVRVEPASFRLSDRAGNRHPVTPGVEQLFPPVELRPRSAPDRQGERTEGNLTFELPRTAQGLALLYEPADGAQPLRIPLPPEFG
jgi:hypothetical protein